MCGQNAVKHDAKHKVFQALDRHNVSLNIEKCGINCKQVKYVDYEVFADGVKPMQ